MVKCNKCGEEITWKHPYAEYLKLKQADPNFRNIPLNPDGTNHVCGQIKQDQPIKTADKVDTGMRDIVEAIKELTKVQEKIMMALSNIQEILESKK